MRIFTTLLLLLTIFGSTSFQKKNDASPPKKTAAAAPPRDSLVRPFPLPKKLVWLEATALKNETFAALLTRFDLYDFECNHRKFLELNTLTAGLKILPGKKYRLPILVVPYNGKSIRTSLKTNDLELALRVQSFNKNAKNGGQRADDFIQSKQLWVAWHEYECPAEGEVAAAEVEKVEQVEKEKKQAEKDKKSNRAERPLPEIGEEKSHAGGRVFPIFGAKYQKTPLASTKLKGKVFYIISGHGGPDTGAEGKHGRHTMCEDEYAYDVSLRLTRLLISHGATAFMIVRDPDDGIRDSELLDCDRDEQVWGKLEIPRPQKARLFQRSDLVNAMTEKYLKKGIKDQTLLEIHVDSRGKNARADVFFYFRRADEPSEKLARKIHQKFYQKYLKVRAQRKYTGTVTARDLHTLRETTAPKAVYVELGNIRNAYDQQRILLPTNRQSLANWLGEALMER